MDTLLKILTELRPDVDFNSEKQLITDGIIESIDLVIIVGEIMEQFSVEIEFTEITPENFNSAEAIYALIERSR